jgi:nicotinamide-nucleotide amidase
MIPNETGTAPGFKVEPAQGRLVCSLSGVPKEFKSMFTSSVLPLIRARYGSGVVMQRSSCKIFGHPESQVGKIVKGLDLPADITVSYRVLFPEVHLVLKANAAFPLEAHAEKVHAALDASTIFTYDPKGTFEGSIYELLLKHSATIATAESCTGGLVAEMLTRTPGASTTFVGGVVAYSNQIKERELGVSSDTLREHGAVSAATVCAMAQGIREKYGATYGVAISGIAGPEGGTAEKPVGTFFVAVAGPTRTIERRCLYVSDRQGVRTYAAYVALDIVRRELSGMIVPEGYPLRDTLR